LDLLEERSTLVVKREAQQLLPSIALSAGYTREGDDSDMKNREDKVITGVSLSWPFPDQRDRAERDVAEIAAKKTQLENENIHYRLHNTLQDLFVRMESEKELMAIADEKISLAESVLKDESENYTFGRVTLNDYIQAVNSLDSNRFNQVSHLVAWRRLFTEWLRLTDQLVNEKQIQDRHETYAPVLEKSHTDR
jgi:outer membrane protein TolC